MSLEDKLAQDYVQAMKARDSFSSSVLSFLRAQIKNVKVDKRMEAVPDEEVIAVIKKQEGHKGMSPPWKASDSELPPSWLMAVWHIPQCPRPSTR